MRSVLNVVFRPLNKVGIFLDAPQLKKKKLFSFSFFLKFKNLIDDYVENYTSKYLLYFLFTYLIFILGFVCVEALVDFFIYSLSDQIRIEVISYHFVRYIKTICSSVLFIIPFLSNLDGPLVYVFVLYDSNAFLWVVSDLDEYVNVLYRTKSNGVDEYGRFSMGVVTISDSYSVVLKLILHYIDTIYLNVVTNIMNDKFLCVSYIIVKGLFKLVMYKLLIPYKLFIDKFGFIILTYYIAYAYYQYCIEYRMHHGIRLIILYTFIDLCYHIYIISQFTVLHALEIGVPYDVARVSYFVAIGMHTCALLYYVVCLGLVIKSLRGNVLLIRREDRVRAFYDSTLIGKFKYVLCLRNEEIEALRKKEAEGVVLRDIVLQKNI